MKRLAVLPLALLAASSLAATAYVSDELVLGVYAEENNQGQRLTTLHSGASVETLSQSGDYTQVRLADGTTGWVKSAFLTTKEPAVVRVKQLEEELDRSRAITPALAEAAAQLAARSPASVAAPPATALGPPAEIQSGIGAQVPLLAGIAAAVGLACGFWLGYATLARRVRRKFGGIKVY
jgi:uncharacterized protein YgiM (DUF1202 family)